ncbi:MAG: hypothetical protein KAS15_04495, partial [Nanoarchaeota archaeon]|nr:hypothetical protein [Nanoarchaeota archaeon]
RNIRDIATLCYIPRITEGKGGELATVANELLRVTTSLQNSIAAGIIDEEDDKENVLKLSIRANAPDRLINARKIAERFNGGGEDLKAGAQLKLGLLKYSCGTKEFKELISNEIECRLVDSKLYEGEDKPEKPVFQKPSALDEILKYEDIEVDLAPHIKNAAKNYSMRGNNNYITLFANRDIDSEDETLKVLHEEDIPALIETGNFYLETLKKSKKYKSCNTSFIYGLITGGVEPYVVAIVSSLKGEKKKNNNFNHENISSKVFGDLISEKETMEDDILKREIIRVPLPTALKYTPEHQYIHKVIYNEIEERLGHSLGKKSNNLTEKP